ncbi:glyoxalase III HchA [Corynebacterium lowii]|uniref:Molecular chaperone Hsp31 and glyoxalase 3 n=1 Tax=Corynebacterium lowii TaxID=1544413 RepID=A0A0Q0ZAK7_9CORY|nr:glyoxalase III HchA [Corynebacterium lowii]KQB86953.1 Molecular chaperone Hsp31 and glyoxalase 3 [Corynebacterium lowii]MDP9851642.1 molecular chaperone Hsp31 and glyoxalase 3 [Corynebacterium lowii]
MSDRTPTPDPAEDRAFFPSPYSLSQYTADTTNFDGLATEEKYTGGRWKVLVIAADERYMLMQNGTFFSTGNHPVETLLPLHHMMQAGYGVDIATLSGGPGKFEWWAYPHKDEAVTATWEATQQGFKTPHQLSALLASGLDDYAAIFIPGGHGAMNGLPFSPDLRDALEFFVRNDRLIITLCHGPAGLLAAGVGRESNPFSSYKLVAFPDSLDFGTNMEIGYLPGAMPWKLGERLTEAGMEILNSDMSGATTRDRNLLTGDSPLAAHQLGKESALALLEQFNQ